jgi:hypothetical protein
MLGDLGDVAANGACAAAFFHGLDPVRCRRIVGILAVLGCTAQPIVAPVIASAIRSDQIRVNAASGSQLVPDELAAFDPIPAVPPLWAASPPSQSLLPLYDSDERTILSIASDEPFGAKRPYIGGRCRPSLRSCGPQRHLRS